MRKDTRLLMAGIARDEGVDFETERVTGELRRHVFARRGMLLNATHIMSPKPYLSSWLGQTDDCKLDGEIERFFSAPTPAPYEGEEESSDDWMLAKIRAARTHGGDERTLSNLYGLTRRRGRPASHPTGTCQGQ